MRLFVVRDGTAIMFSEFGQQPVSFGDAVLLGPNVLCGIEPEGQLTFTTITIDTDLALDQFYWQYSAILHDRFEAQGFAEKVYSEPAQILHLGRDHAGLTMPWLDEMVALSAGGQFHESFPRLQSLWFAVVDVIAPYVRVSPVRLTRLQRARSRPFTSRDRVLSPLRREAMLVRDALHRQSAYPWTLTELASLVQLSPKQLARVFTAAFGKTPTAYLVMLRVQEMARLLRETNITVTAAGRRVGWHSRSRAVEAFVAHTGVTPSRYRHMRPFIADVS
ncbi:AraC family transcriptional regulator [Brevibacterium luteolum]|uniref:AraC family transcriptional regulator n=1 Tax=Brevibacterium luteolum TaxID=199591 RepID=A0A6G8L0M2_9MICO|nr:AraC family transcriptional regulator [Brevibacterium luteolum]